MIKVCVADNFPVVHYGIKSFFKDHSDISIVANIGNFSMLKEILQSKEIDVLLLDLELEGLKSIFEVKAILKEFPETKVIIYSNLSEQIYAPNAIKAGVSGSGLSPNSRIKSRINLLIKYSRIEIIISEVC